MVALLIAGAYMVGVYKTKVEYLEGGAPNQVAQVAGEQAVAAPAEEKTELTEDEWQKVLSGAEYTVGSENAPVTIVEFTDYQCPFCARFYEQSYGQIMSEYVETGKVRYIFRDLPLPFHPNAEPAAVAARCAGKQNKYVEMHDKLFETQTEWESVSDTTALFTGYAKEVGVGEGAFTSCLSDTSVAEAVQADADLAAEVGATGTPTFYVNGTALVGAQPYASFKTLIDSKI